MSTGCRRTLRYGRCSSPIGSRRRQPDWTFNMLLKHGVRSCLEYAKTFDLARARRCRTPRSRPHLEFVDLGGHGYATVRLTGDEMRTEFVCIPTPDRAERASGRRAHPVSGITRCCTVEERRAPAAEDIGARRRCLSWRFARTLAGLGGVEPPPNTRVQRTRCIRPRADREPLTRHPLGRPMAIGTLT